MLRPTTVSVLLLTNLLSISLFGQSPFSRYRTDQKREGVTVGAAVFPSPANGKIPLTERQVVEMALTHNFDTNLQRSAVLEQTSRIDQLRGI